MKKSIVFCVFALLGLVPLLLPITSQAETINIFASDWGTARDNGADGSFESMSFPNNILIGRNSGSYIDRGAWEFDLSGLPSGTITRIDLSFRTISTTLERAGFEIFSYLGDGVVDTSDVTGGSFLSSLDGDLALFSLDVTSFILDTSTLAAGYAGFYTKYENELATYAFKQFGDSGSPLLIVEYSTVVPVPAAAWLFGTGLLGLIGVARRKKS